MQDKRITVLEMIKEQFPDCEIRTFGGILEVKRNSVVLNFGRPIIIDELIYYYDNGILKEELNKLKEK